MSFFITAALLVASRADPAIVRDFDVEVVVEVPADATIKLPKLPATRKQELGHAGPIARHGDRNAVDLSFAVLSEALRDPLALLWVLMLVAYFAHSHLLPAKADTVEPSRSDWDALSAASSTSGKSRKSRTDRFALVVNQKLTKLTTVDEVLDFAISSAETGRTDIVNAVTAIHRSAKLVAGKPQASRSRVAQDPRMRQLLDQLLRFLEEDLPAPLLARAVGNTSWALAKLQYRQDPKQPHAILEALQSLFVRHAEVFKPEELMNTVWAFGELRRDKDGPEGEARALAVAKALCRCRDKVHLFTSQQVVYFSWALARLSSVHVKQESTELKTGLRGFAEQVLERAPAVSELNAKNLAMLSWALASLHANLGLVELERPVQQRLGEVAELLAQRGFQSFLPGEISSLVWALTKARVDSESFYARLKDHLLAEGLSRFSVQDVSTLVGAFVKTERGDSALYDMLAKHATTQNRNCSRSEKMAMNWALSQMPPAHAS